MERKKTPTVFSNYKSNFLGHQIGAKSRSNVLIGKFGFFDNFYRAPLILYDLKFFSSVRSENFLRVV